MKILESSVARLLSYLGLNENSSEIWNVFLFKFLLSVTEVLILFFLILFAIQWLLSYISVEKIRKAMEKVHPVLAHFLAAFFGAATPFCTCSSIPVFTGLLKAGISPGIAFSFLITSPLVNEIALAAIWAIFGTKIALMYVILGLAAGVLGGFILGRIRVEKYLKVAVEEKNSSCCDSSCCGGDGEAGMKKSNFLTNLKNVWKESLSIIAGVLPYLLAGVAVGVAVTMWASTQWIERLNHENQFLMIPLAIVLGAPIYTSIAAVIPVIASLVSKGMGTGLAFALMMSIGGMSLPEWMMLSGLMKKRLLACFIGITALMILCVSYVFALWDLR